MPVLKVIGYRWGLEKVSMTKTYRDQVGLNLKQAKSLTDDLLEGKAIVLNIEDEEEAEALKEKLCKIGAIVKIEKGTKETG